MARLSANPEKFLGSGRSDNWTNTLASNKNIGDEVKQVARVAFIERGLDYAEIHELISHTHLISRAVIYHWAAEENWKKHRADRCAKELAAIGDAAIAVSTASATAWALKRDALIQTEIETELEIVDRGRSFIVPIDNANDLAAWVRAQRGLADLAHMALRIPAVSAIPAELPKSETPQLKIVAPLVAKTIEDWARSISDQLAPPPGEAAKDRSIIEQVIEDHGNVG